MDHMRSRLISEVDQLLRAAIGTCPEEMQKLPPTPLVDKVIQLFQAVQEDPHIKTVQVRLLLSRIQELIDEKDVRERG